LTAGRGGVFIHQLMASLLWILDAGAVGVIDLQLFGQVGEDDDRNSDCHEEYADSDEPGPDNIGGVQRIICLQALLAETAVQKLSLDVGKRFEFHGHLERRSKRPGQRSFSL